MCNSTVVRYYLPRWCPPMLDRVWFADCADVATECIDLDRRGVQMLEWSFPADGDWGTSLR